MFIDNLESASQKSQQPAHNATTKPTHSSTDRPTLNITLSTQAFYILLALTQRPLHGYGIRDQIAQDSESRLILAPGTVYIILKRLTKQGLVLRLADPNPRYLLTQQGRTRLHSEISRLEHATNDARRKLATLQLPNHEF